MEIIKLNLIPSGVNPTCHCSQYDNGRVIRIDLFDGLTPYVLQSGDTVTLNVRKPDNTIVTTSLTATQGNTYVNLVTTEQICACVGYNLCDLTITNGSVVIGTLNFIMQVERDVLADGIPSQSVIEDLDALVAEAVDTELGDNYYTKTEVDTALNTKANASEVEDIRIGANGKTYSSAGDAVRGQSIENINTIDFANGCKKIDFVQGACIRTDSTPIDITSPVSNTAYQYAVISCNAGDVFTVSAKGSNIYRAFAFLDSSKNPLWLSANGYVANNLVLIAPENSAYLLINDTIAQNNNSYYGRSLNDHAVQVDGVAQVKTKNINGMIKTDSSIISDNIFSDAVLLKSGYYVGINNGQISFTANAAYDTYIIPVDSSNYYFTNVRFGVLLKADQTMTLGNLISNVTTIDATNASYIAWSFNKNNYPTETYKVYKDLSVYRIPLNWDLSSTKALKKPIGAQVGTLANGEYIEISGRSALKDGEIILFKGVLSAFGSLRLAFMYAGGVSNYIDVDSTNVTIKNNTSNASVLPHGLTIINDITIMVEFIRGDAKITVISDGSLYTTTIEWTQISAVASSPRVISTNTTCTYAELKTIYNAVARKVWYFGDSYITISNAQRWVYYLKQFNYDTNILLSGSAGCSSAITRTAFEALLKYGNPKLAVMATGMNDGNDDGDTPATTWSTNRDYFISNCQRVYAEPIFCTIPTTPTVNNEAKNNWVRNSGYRYIDFAKAVGAQPNGTWYSGMLAADNVHPTELGARALFTQALIDLPEIFLNK